MEKGSMFGDHKVMKRLPSSSPTIQTYLMNNTMCHIAGQVLEGTMITPPWSLASEASHFLGKMLWCDRMQILNNFQDLDLNLKSNITPTD